MAQNEETVTTNVILRWKWTKYNTSQHERLVFVVGFLDARHLYTEARHANAATHKILQIVGCMESNWIAVC